MANASTFDTTPTSPAQQVSSSGTAEDDGGPPRNGAVVSAEEDSSAWNELIFGNLFKPKQRRIVKAIPPPSSSALLSFPIDISHNAKDDHKDESSKEEDDSEIDPLQLQKEERRREAQQRHSKHRAQMLQQYRLSHEENKPNSTDSPPAFLANPMSRFLSVFSVHAHPEHKRRATIETPDDEDTVLLSPKRPRPMEPTEQTETTTTEARVSSHSESAHLSQKDESSPSATRSGNRGAVVVLALLGAVVTATMGLWILFLSPPERRNQRTKITEL